MTQTVGQLIVKCLEAQNVEFVFGLPGAKIDAVFDALVDSPIRLILCRHEQNAAFMAAAYGRLTGKPGVVLVTSGPGIGNLCTGLLTATTEGDPIIALAGNVSRNMTFKESHQSADNVNLVKSATKSAVQVDAASCIPEQVANAFRCATAPRQGACLLSFPQDLLHETTDMPPIVANTPTYGTANAQTIQATADLLRQAQRPLILLGEEASEPNVAKAVDDLLRHCALAVVGTYQAAGVIARDLLHCYVGRVGLFDNQPGDPLLKNADVILTIGFNPAEYDPEIWHAANQAKLIHLSYVPADIRNHYIPTQELLGDIAGNLNLLREQLPAQSHGIQDLAVKQSQQEYFALIDSGASHNPPDKVHPLAFIHKLRAALDDEAYVMCDIGSNYMWMARYFLCYQPRHLLFSNGQQTLGVALPYAMATRLVHPHHEIISISGDGGFLFSANELETAVREQLKFIHFIWTDGTYNMVKIQQDMKYDRHTAVALGHLDAPTYAQSFGAQGFNMRSIDEFDDILAQARAATGPVIINVQIDYRDNDSLIAPRCPHEGH